MLCSVNSIYRNYAKVHDVVHILEIGETVFSNLNSFFHNVVGHKDNKDDLQKKKLNKRKIKETYFPFNPINHKYTKLS